MRDNFYIITGGPGAGKTTLLEELSRYKVRCVPEVARQIIREQMFYRLKEEYTACSYEVVEVPRAPVEERALFILDRIRHPF